MSDLYAALNVSPSKKRRSLSDGGDDEALSPKKMRILRTIESKSSLGRAAISATKDELPPHLTRLQNIHITLQHALSHALATYGVSPSCDTGVLINVINHVSFNSYSGLTSRFEVDDLRQLVWVWEWDGDALSLAGESDDNPFLERTPPPESKDWRRGGMGLVVTSTSHLHKQSGKRIPAYGIGIEVEMDIDKGMSGGMAAVARWTTAGEARRKEFTEKLRRWVKLNSEAVHIPSIPRTDLPVLTSRPSALTRLFESVSPKAAPTGGPAPPAKKAAVAQTKTPTREFAHSLPITPVSLDRPKFPLSMSGTSDTPSRRPAKNNPSSTRTPGTQNEVTLSTPVRQTGSGAGTTPGTPSSSRRQALYERIRTKSLTSPMKPAPGLGSSISNHQILKLGQEEMRRRVLLGRLNSVAESVWMLFTSSVGSLSSPTTRKRRAMATPEVAAAIVKSSPVPISDAEALESLKLLTDLCPFFLKDVEIQGEDWLEMPWTSMANGTSEHIFNSGKDESAEEIVSRSPRRVKREVGGLRDVRERIRRELEASD